ncbi:MAG: hypothetical protein LUD72_02580 [Bacteroidales bacterium]|nr:hypothetical protein [Bacteroidales bacterium]
MMAEIKNVHPGDLIMFRRRGKLKPDGHYDEIIEEWMVVDVYPHHVLCECDGIRESFSYGELVQMGLEKTETGMEKDNTVDGFHWNVHKEDGEVY